MISEYKDLTLESCLNMPGHANEDTEGDGWANYEECPEVTNPFAAPLVEMGYVDRWTPLLMMIGGIGVGAVIIYGLMRKRMMRNLGEVVPEAAAPIKQGHRKELLHTISSFEIL